MQKNTQIHLDNNTPPSTPTSSQILLSSRGRIAVRNRRILKVENMVLKDKLKLLEKKLSKYRMRFRRSKIQKPTEQIHREIKSNKKFLKAKKYIQEFLELDENSRLTAGKKETKTHKKVKKQIRLLNDTMLNLYRKFKAQSDICVSYAFFCRYRPFWVTFPTAKNRETCLCMLHANTEYLIKCVSNADMISEKSPLDLVKSMCCNRNLNGNCLERSCADCQHKDVHFNPYEKKDKVTYSRWVSKKVLVVIKGKEKLCQKTLKETVASDKITVAQILKVTIGQFMIHIRNIMQQQRTLRQMKCDLQKDSAILHMDFSENYNCKYATEVQSAHFGGSKPQISLHTSVLYFVDETSNQLITKSFCTLSENLRHDPVFICAHLKPVFKQIKLLVPKLKTMHFFSDGPTTQYRNKSMFLLIAKNLSIELGVENILWHFSEAGHGKGAPDGVGGCVKRIADRCVALGQDVSDFQRLVFCLQENCHSIEVVDVGDEDVQSIERIFEANQIKPFKGTMKVHQITWSNNEPNILHARRLSCGNCLPSEICTHFELGQITVKQAAVNRSFEDDLDSENDLIFERRRPSSLKKLTVDDVYSESDDNSREPLQEIMNIIPAPSPEPPQDTKKYDQFFWSSDDESIFN